MQPDRIPCINPNCRRTAPDDGTFTEIICRKCFHSLPPRLVNRAKRVRKVVNRMNRWPHKFTVEQMRRFAAHHHAAWDRIRDYYQKPQEPEGLESFLSKMGMR